MTVTVATLRSRQRMNLCRCERRQSASATITRRWRADGAPLASPMPAGLVDFVAAARFAGPGLSVAPALAASVGTGQRGGQATVLLQADHASRFSEAEHVESARRPAFRWVGEMSVADSILAGATPASDSVRPAFHAVTQAYSNVGTNTMQRYIDSYYVQTPSRVAVQLGPIATSSWTDYQTTVLAFAKPDADPLSPDSGMAAASIQITFRDWVTHWIVDDFFGDLTNLIGDYRAVFPCLIHTDLRQSVSVLGEVGTRARHRHSRRPT